MTERPRPAARDLATVPGAPPAGTRLAHVDDIAENGSRVLTFSEGNTRFEMFLHRRGDLVVAYENSCPHQYLPLDWRPGQFLSSTGDEFICSSHGARFRIEDGYCTLGPCAGAWLRPVRIHIEQGEILVA